MVFKCNSFQRSIQQSTHMVGEIYRAKDVENVDKQSGIFSIVRVFPNRTHCDDRDATMSDGRINGDAGFVVKNSHNGSARKVCDNKRTNTDHQTFLVRFVRLLQV